jgi:hypothetical protein
MLDSCSVAAPLLSASCVLGLRSESDSVHDEIDSIIAFRGVLVLGVGLP